MSVRSASSPSDPIVVPVTVMPGAPPKNEVKPALEALFDKYVFKAGTTIPSHIDVRGAFVMTRDTNAKGWLHVLISLVQRIHAWIVGRKDADPYFSHGLIVLDRNTAPEAKLNHLIIAHSVFDGIVTASRNYLGEEDVTEIQMYVPKTEHLRELMLKHANQTVYNSRVDGVIKADSEGANAVAAHPKTKKIAPFSITDLICGIFKNPAENVRTEGVRKRVSYAVADLLLGNQILNRKNEPKALYCTPYMTAVLQGSLLINAMAGKEDTLLKDLNRPRTRDEIAGLIHARIAQKNENDPLSKTYWENPVCGLNARFIASSFAPLNFDKISEDKGTIRTV